MSALTGTEGLRSAKAEFVNCKDTFSLLNIIALEAVTRNGTRVKHLSKKERHNSYRDHSSG